MYRFLYSQLYLPYTNINNFMNTTFKVIVSWILSIGFEKKSQVKNYAENKLQIFFTFKYKLSILSRFFAKLVEFML